MSLHVDQFDEDEFPDVPKAPAALLAALKAVPDPRKPWGLRHQLPGILAIAGCAVIAGARSFVAIAEWPGRRGHPGRVGQTRGHRCHTPSSLRGETRRYTYQVTATQIA